MFLRRQNSKNESNLDSAMKNLSTGSAEAFHILYNEYSNKVYKFCLKMTGDTIAAQDAFQETFIRIYENRTIFKGDNFGAWLFTIARNTCLNYLRTKKDFVDVDTMWNLKDDSQNIDICLKDQIEKAISMLPISLREALILREYEDYSYQEIANILGIDLSLAKVRVYRARTILRQILKPLVKEINES